MKRRSRSAATSPPAKAQVVFQNALFQLIQYKPLTAKVYARPFVLVPPCINKYYILDLQPENSLIRHAVGSGHTVFVVSWKNPHQAESKLTWDDYLEQGAIKALHVAQQISGQKQVNALGFCVGGTILATALAVMFARGETPVSSLTMMTALLDFEDPGMLDLFIDEHQVRQRERTLGKGGLMPGRELAVTFNNLRSNDLVWNYVVNNYLQGKQPPAFDLLYWNGDSTNLPGPMYAWYLRNMYLENNLRVPGKLVCCGERIDLGSIKVPTYVFAAREDHIVPWKAAYASARLLPGTSKAGGVRFVLGASGHIAGSINPPSKNKRSYWTGERAKLPADPEAWLADARKSSRAVGGPIGANGWRSLAVRKRLRRKDFGQYDSTKRSSRRPAVTFKKKPRSDLTMSNAVIVAAARTPIGKFGGSLAKIPASDLGAHRDQGSAQARRRETRASR